MGIGLSIVFSGLCALVTDGATGSGQVVLVDTRSLGEVGGVPLPAHAPTLVLGLGSLVNPELSGPDRVVADWPGSGGSVGQVGLWDLTGSEVRVRVQGREASGLRVFSQADGQSSWPEPPRDANDPSSWRDIRYVADMASITADGRIRPELLANAGGRLPRGVAARIHLDDGVIESGLPSREEFREEVFEFAANGRRGGIRQALTDTLHWSHETSAETVVIEIAPASGGPVRRLMLKPRVETHRLLIGNLPSHDADRHAQGPLDETIAALHFGAYYELLRHSPDARPMPRLVGPDELRSTGVSMGPICPPARFTIQ